MSKALTAYEQALADLGPEAVVLDAGSIPETPTIELRLVAPAKGNKRARFEGEYFGAVADGPVAPDSDIRVQVYVPEPLASSITGTGVGIAFELADANDLRPNPAPHWMRNPEGYSRISSDKRVLVLVFDADTDTLGDDWDAVRAVVKWPLGYDQEFPAMESITLTF